MPARILVKQPLIQRPKFEETYCGCEPQYEPTKGQGTVVRRVDLLDDLARSHDR